MKTFEAYLTSIENPEHAKKLAEILKWIANEFPDLDSVIKWNTPMFSHHGTFIIGISVAKHHLSISPEQAGITQFKEEIDKAGYSSTKGLYRVKWSEPVDFELLKNIIQFNIQDKIDFKKFWR